MSCYNSTVKNKRWKFSYLCLALVGCFMIATTFFLDTSKADENEDITISSNTSWPAGTYTYRDIIVTNNATLTLQGSYTNDNDGIGVTINARNIRVDSGSSINANAQGHIHETGPGKGYVGTSGYGSGAAHGGNGAAAALNNIAQKNTLLYDIAFGPSMLGSGGGRSNGGTGGGSIIINTQFEVIINGSISANGGAGGASAGGGSGGSVNISANTISGTGSVSSIGGNGPSNSGSGAGGGRISFYYAESYALTSANISVAGGTGFNGRNGDAGTIIIFNTATKDLQVDHNLILYKDEGLNQDGEPTTDGNYYFRNLSIGNNAILYPKSTYTDNTDGAGLKFYLSGDLTINSGSKIDAKGGGYIYNSGPGTGTGTGLLGGGAGHGGAGGNGNSGTGGSSYGDTLLPLTLGSGGHAPGGGSGGGAVYFDIDGDVIANGDIDASGNNAVGSGSNRGSGGSGGSIFIKSDSISGSGNILANGGAGLEYSGGGAGGRVALYSDTTSFPANQISATGGARGGLGASQAGGIGTVFIYDIATGDVTASNDVTFEATQGLSPDGSFRDDGVYYFNDFTVSDGATVTIGSYYTDESDGHGVTINIAGNLIVESGSQISANGQGYTGTVGAGKGAGGSSQSGSGGSYGGLGGTSYNPVSPGTVYGTESATFPYMLGSGGGAGDGGTGGSGGGAITLRALGDVTVNGEISADGGVGTGGFSSWRPGGGSGGSIFIVCDNISGSGTITADGGDGLGTETFPSGAGGGGRISIVYQTALSISLDNVTASGGAGVVAGNNGSDGTVRTESRELPSNTFNLKNPNNDSTQYTNTLDVTMEPIDEDVDQYSESGSTSNLVPAFYDSSWQDVETGVTLTANEGEKMVKAWLKDTDQLISSQVGQATITLDMTEPSITLDEATNETNESSIVISGNISDILSGVDRATISQVQSQSIQSFDEETETFTEQLAIDESGDFEIECDLEAGENEIVVSALDRAGNEISQTINIFSSQVSSTATPVPTSTSTSATPTSTATSSTQETTGSAGTTDENDESYGGLAMLPSDTANETESEQEMLDTKSTNTIDGSDSIPSKEKTSEKDKYLFLVLLLLIIAIILISIGIKKRRQLNPNN